MQACVLLLSVLFMVFVCACMCVLMVSVLAGFNLIHYGILSIIIENDQRKSCIFQLFVSYILHVFILEYFYNHFMRTSKCIVGTLTCRFFFIYIITIKVFKINICLLEIGLMYERFN